MVEQDTDRQERIKRANEELRDAHDLSVDITKNFGQEKNFEVFLEETFYGALKLKEKYDSNSLSLAMYITDKLAEDWPEGNLIIIEEAKHRGINPSDNLIGERLEAMDCLRQVLNKPTEENTP